MIKRWRKFMVWHARATWFAIYWSPLALAFAILRRYGIGPMHSLVECVQDIEYQREFYRIAGKNGPRYEWFAPKRTFEEVTFEKVLR